MISVKVDKLWKGKYVSIRDYIVKDAKKTRQALKIRHRGQIMTVPYSELDKGIKNPDIFKSKINGHWYKLIDYEFKPNNKNQIALL